MKNLLLVLIAVLTSITAFTQTVFTGKIVNENNEALYGATIQSTTNNNNVTVSDFNGDFEITLVENPNVLISYLGYASLEIALTQTATIIALTTKTNTLHEIVISASREKQKRSEVPAAISIISAKKLEETKAFGIDQIVNDTPGVFVSSSKSSGNEQHFTATRSPISTRALFLYLEDGLPIRPTAVFNHNALLESNSISFKKVEILKGPGSSIYGSEAIGGSFNFITKDPSKDLTGSLSFQGNDLGLINGGFEISKYITNKLGFYVGTQYTERNNGPFGNSNYEKFASTFKLVYDFSDDLKFTSVYDHIDFRTDTSGSLTEDDYRSQNFESDQTFTERDAYVIRLRNTLEKTWDANNKTMINFIYRDNQLAQIPSFRIRQNINRSTNQLTGTGSGRINDNHFKSYFGLAQHKLTFKKAKASLILGTSIDFSPQDYVEENTSVIVNPTTGINTSFTINENDFVLNYQADIFNSAWYTQFEFNPIDPLKITVGGRFDSFEYDFKNKIEGGQPDSVTTYNNFSPKIGVNYNPINILGIYANYSKGFTPPQTSTLYRNTRANVKNINLRPSTFDNYEIGLYTTPLNGLKIDLTAYLLRGKNTLISIRDENTNNILNTNAGGTISHGIEYGVSYKITDEFHISHNGSYAKHEYRRFSAVISNRNGITRDFSNTEQEIAPRLLGNSQFKYSPKYLKGFSITLNHELIGEYNTSLEGRIDNQDGTFSTEKYNGHNIFNGLLSYKYKKIELWGQVLNIFDKLYAVRASYNTFSNQNTFVTGNLRAFHAGIKYNF